MQAFPLSQATGSVLHHGRGVQVPRNTITATVPVMAQPELLIPARRRATTAFRFPGGHRA